MADQVARRRARGRPNKSAHDAIGATRLRCWKYDWAIDLDIRGFFDNLDPALLMQVLEEHTDCGWLKLNVERRSPQNLVELKQMLVEEWGKIPKNVLKNLVNSMSTRCQKAIEAQGGLIKY